MFHQNSITSSNVHSQQSDCAEKRLRRKVVRRSVDAEMSVNLPQPSLFTLYWIFSMVFIIICDIRSEILNREFERRIKVTISHLIFFFFLPAGLQMCSETLLKNVWSSLKIFSLQYLFEKIDK